MADDDVPGWDGYFVRSDRLQVIKDPVHLDTWIVVTPDARPDILLCPCCGRPMRTERAAKLVANRVYPLERGGADAD